MAQHTNSRFKLFVPEDQDRVHTVRPHHLQLWLVAGHTTGLNSSSITNTSATVSWTAVPGAVTYNLQWKASSSSTWTTVNGITATSSDLTGLTEVTTYQFQVQTVCSAGSSSYSAARIIYNYQW